MAKVRQPQVAGVAGGVGTTTVAVALCALDNGRYVHGDPVDVLVARATLYSLGLVQQALATVPLRPVLAVVGELPGSTTSRAIQARITMTEAGLAGVVYVPYVRDWATNVRPHEAAAAAVTAAAETLERPVRAFVAAIRQLIDAVSPLVVTDPEGPDYPSSAEFLPDRERATPRVTRRLEEHELLPELPKFTPFHSR